MVRCQSRLEGIASNINTEEKELKTKINSNNPEGIETIVDYLVVDYIKREYLQQRLIATHIYETPIRKILNQDAIVQIVQEKTHKIKKEIEEKSIRLDDINANIKRFEENHASFDREDSIKVAEDYIKRQYLEWELAT
ncbi:MAG: hypothetical protein LBR09_01710 [Endomicrobium sp.]|jgi:hypothetical protein|nr:hypothetical protein [Endomicrobium sp.]